MIDIEKERLLFEAAVRNEYGKDAPGMLIRDRDGDYATMSTEFVFWLQRAALADAPVTPTPRVDALLAQWDDDGATRGAAFIELRDLARSLEQRNDVIAAAISVAKESLFSQCCSNPIKKRVGQTSRPHQSQCSVRFGKRPCS